MVLIFFRESFNLWRPLLMIAHYHQIKTPISFWCRRRLNFRSLIQPSETLPVELTETHENGIIIFIDLHCTINVRFFFFFLGVNVRFTIYKQEVYNIVHIRKKKVLYYTLLFS